MEHEGEHRIPTCRVELNCLRLLLLRPPLPFRGGGRSYCGEVYVMRYELSPMPSVLRPQVLHAAHWSAVRTGLCRPFHRSSYSGTPQAVAASAACLPSRYLWRHWPIQSLGILCIHSLCNLQWHNPVLKRDVPAIKPPARPLALR